MSKVFSIAMLLVSLFPFFVPAVVRADQILPGATPSASVTSAKVANADAVANSMPGAPSPAEPAASATPALMSGNRVLSVYIAQSFINEQIALHSKSELIKEVKLTLDPVRDQILVTGVIHVPIEEMRAINLDPKLGIYRFQVAVKLTTTPRGHLIIEFPLTETYFYPADSRDRNDRIFVPVQMLSLALASMRGYIAALSGDFKGFDRRTDKLLALRRSLERSIAEEKNVDAREEMKNQRESIRVQLEAIPIERKQLEALSKQIASVMGFTGEKEINLNQELAAKKNALILKVRISQLAPFLTGVDLGKIRLIHDKKDGGNENYLAIDINAQSSTGMPEAKIIQPAHRDAKGMKVAPVLMLRLNQSLLESEAVINEEKAAMGSHLKAFDLQLKDDGLHVSGKGKILFFSVPFDTIVDFVTTKPDVFEVRVREIKVAGLDFDFLTNYVLDSVKKRLDATLAGMCTFENIGAAKDGSRALRVTVDPKALMPAFPELHLIDVDVREREFLLKLGKI